MGGKRRTCFGPNWDDYVPLSAAHIQQIDMFQGKHTGHFLQPPKQCPPGGTNNDYGEKMGDAILKNQMKYIKHASYPIRYHRASSIELAYNKCAY